MITLAVEPIMAVDRARITPETVNNKIINGGGGCLDPKQAQLGNMHNKDFQTKVEQSKIETVGMLVLFNMLTGLALC